MNEIQKQRLTSQDWEIKNAAFNAAAKEKPILTMEDFVGEIKKELSGSFDNEKSMGFLS